MKKILFYSILVVALISIVPKEMIKETINNTKTFYNIIKSENTKLPEVDMEQFGDNFYKLQKSIDDNFELLDELEKQNKMGE